MNKLSRTKRYQDLRNRLDEETTLAHAEDVKVMPSRSSRVNNGNLSHANQPLHPHQEEPKNNDIEFQASPVMDELLGEVKQYNIDNGSRYDNDTQINILRQLDSASEPRRKNSHFIDMEESPEVSGNTVKLPKSVNQDLDVASFMNRADLDDDMPARKKDSKVVLNSSNIKADSFEEDERIDLFDEIDEEETESRPRKNKKLKKAKKKKERRIQEDDVMDDMPSAKMRMISEDYEEVQENKKSGKVINVILFILIMLLLATIGVAFFMLKESGMI